MNRLLTCLSLSVVLGASLACKKDEAAPPPAEARKQPMNAPPPAGTDADTQRIQALDLAVKIDAALASYDSAEKVDAKRKVEAWTERATPPKPRKIVITGTGTDGAPEVTDLYYDDKGMLQLARAPDGLFIFQMESLALWLDRDQKVKRGLDPSLTKTRVDAIMADNRTTLGMFGLR